MSQHTSRFQAVLLLIGAIWLVTLAFGTPVGSQTDPNSEYPAQTATAGAIQTATAQQLTRTALVTLTPTSATPQATVLPTPTLTSIPTTRPLPTFLPNPTLTPTPAEPITGQAAEPAIRNCLPGVPMLIRGNAPARAGLLLFFAKRAVGGGVADANGNFSLSLTIGNERPGEYQIAVYVRGSWQEVFRASCTVPRAGS
jgi:hypothetical protein